MLSVVNEVVLGREERYCKYLDRKFRVWSPEGLGCLNYIEGKTQLPSETCKKQKKSSSGIWINFGKGFLILVKKR